MVGFGLFVATLGAAPVWAADFDLDGVDDQFDNCTETWNPTQLDTDCDTYGDRCDADFTNDGIVSAADYAIIQAGPPTNILFDVDTPFNGVADAADEAYVLANVGQFPGPTGVTTTGPPSCAPGSLNVGPMYCINGTPTGAAYAWQLTGGSIPSANDPVVDDPAPGSLGTLGLHLMLNLASRIDAKYGLSNVYVKHLRLGVPTITGPADCFVLSDPGVTLTVGPPGSPTNCLVNGLGGCVFNPHIFLLSLPVPFLSPGAALSLAALLGGGGSWLIWRRRAQRH